MSCVSFDKADLSQTRINSGRPCRPAALGACTDIRCFEALRGRGSGGSRAHGALAAPRERFRGSRGGQPWGGHTERSVHSSPGAVPGVPGGQPWGGHTERSRLSSRPARAGLSAPRAPRTAAPAARKAPRPGGRWQQPERSPGSARRTFPLASGSLEQGCTGLRSCCSLCSSALAKVMPVRA